MRSRTLLVALGASLLGSGLLLSPVSCLSDPRADDPVTVIDACESSALSSDPASPQATLRAYLASTDLLLVRAQTIANELRDACNAVDTELHGGTPATATDVVSACKPIAARIEAVAKKDPTEPPPGAPAWAELHFSPNCTLDATVLPACVASCAAGCDVSKCDPAQTAAKCEGECKGTCVTHGDGIACNGKCVGEVPIQGPPTTCNGECDGVCTNGAWSGECDASCAGFFRGACGGTCTGTCDGAPINVAPVPDAGDGDAGGEGPPPGPPVLAPPPANANGNCQGFCVGVCSSGAHGACAGSPCLAFAENGPPDLGHYRGHCLGLCGGACKSGYGTGSTQACNGECTATKASCDGLCRGECVGTRSDVVCEGALRCSQNTECENACQARAKLSMTCELPKVIEVYALTDPEFGAALQKHGAKIGKALSELASLRAAFGFIGDRAYGDFLAIGLSGDLARACVAKGAKSVADADVLLRAAVAADPSIRKFQ